MNDLMKKRFKAIMIDSLLSYGVTLMVEPVLKKKIKSEFFHATVTQTLIFWGLEYAQLRMEGQTVGHRAQGLKIMSEDGSELTSGQIAGRLVHRDFISPFSYLRNRQTFDAYDGEILPHDQYAHTVVKKV